MDGLIVGSNDNKLEQLAAYIAAVRVAESGEQPLYNEAAQKLPLSDFMTAAEVSQLKATLGSSGDVEFTFMLSGEQSHIVLADSTTDKSKVEIFNTDKGSYSIVITYADGSKLGRSGVFIFSGASAILTIKEITDPAAVGNYVFQFSTKSSESSSAFGWSNTTSINQSMVTYEEMTIKELSLDRFYFGGGMSLESVKVGSNKVEFTADNLADDSFVGGGGDVYTVAGDVAAISFLGV